MQRSSSNLDDRRRLLEDELIDFDEPEPQSNNNNTAASSSKKQSNNDGGLAALQVAHAHLKAVRAERLAELKNWRRQVENMNSEGKPASISQMEAHPVGNQLVTAWRAAKKDLGDFEDAHPEMRPDVRDVFS